MPELPEVETVRKSLKERLLGKKILSCEVYYNNIIEYPSVERFKHNMNRLKEKINNPNLTLEQKAVCEMEYQAYDIIQYSSMLVQGNYSESSRDILLFAKENYISVKEFETKGISL